MHVSVCVSDVSEMKCVRMNLLLLVLMSNNLIICMLCLLHPLSFDLNSFLLLHLSLLLFCLTNSDERKRRKKCIPFVSE